MVKDMTEGKPGRLILEFAIPLLLGNLFQQFYSLVDTAIVGKFLGVDQLAAVGSTGSINFLIIGFCMGICSGFAIPIAQRFGAKDESGMRRCVANSAWVSVIFAVVLTIVTVLLCRNILQWMRTPENIIDDAWMYIVIIFAGIPVTILYNLTSAIIRAMGDSKNTGLFSGDVGTVKYCTRSVLYSGTENGCCGRSAGNRDFSGNFRYLLSGLYDPQIRDSADAGNRRKG